MKIAIIGGGAAGLVAAITAKTKDNEVVILERNSECAKKILATGNGRCNYWNENQSLDRYESSNKELISKIINKKTEKLVLDFFNNLGIIPKIKNGYYYPMSNQASTIKNVLVNECIDKDIKIIKNYYVEKIEKKNNKFIINNEKEFDKVIISTGSFASPKTGSDGNGFNLLKGHKIIKPLPSLVQLVTKKEKYLDKWKGIRTDVKVSLDNDNEIIEEVGEIQLTDYGISGICVFNLSNIVSRRLYKNKKTFITIDFIPNIEKEDIIKMLKKDKTIGRVLECLLNEKLIKALLINIDPDMYYDTLRKEDKNKLISNLKEFKVEVISTKSFNEAQVASGGVSLQDIKLDTMESKIVSNLYIVGELLDLTGVCGGYNLGIAWRSGILAGLAAKEEVI